MMVTSRHERGTIALEFALLLPVVLLLVGTLTITGLRAVYSALAVHEARLAARDASIRCDGIQCEKSSSSEYPSRDYICSPAKRALVFPGSAFDPNGDADADGNLDCTVFVAFNPDAVDPDTGTFVTGTGDMVTVTLTYNLILLNALGNFVSNAFNVSDLSVVSQSASVMRE